MIPVPTRSSTTYVTGKAVEKCALQVREQICKLGAQMMNCPENEVVFDGKVVRREKKRAAGSNVPGRE